MEKFINSKQFGKITVKNYDYRPTLSEDVEDFIPLFDRVVCIKRKHYFKGRGERSYVYVNWELKACGSYTRTNRSRQRFDFQMSTLRAVKNSLENLTRSEYEAVRKNIEEMREYLKD